MKMIILKYGGIRTFRNLKPLFIGLILGQIVTAGVLTLIAVILRLRSGIPAIIGIG